MLFNDTAVPPLIAILRGVTIDEILHVSELLIERGFGFIEVPLNSPNALKSIELLCKKFGQDCVCGAGTVLGVKALEDVASAGAKIALAPNTDPEVLNRAQSLDLDFVPGIFSPTDALLAVKCGAKTLKLFPASAVPPRYLADIRAILPGSLEIIAVGGVNSVTLTPWIKAGVSGFGIGGELFKPGRSLEDVSISGAKIVAAYEAAV